MIPEIDLNQYCFGESFRLNENMKTGVMKVMDQREVGMMLKGLNLNTLDSSVMQYLGHFGQIVKQEVVYLRNYLFLLLVSKTMTENT